MKKIVRNVLIVCMLFLCFGFTFYQGNLVANAKDYTKEEIEDELNNGVNDQLDEIDFSALDKLLAQFTSEQSSIFGSHNFAEKIKQLISGDLGDEYNSVFGAITSVLLDNVLKYIPLLATIVAIAVLSSIVNGIKPMGHKSVSDIIHFVCYGTIVVLLTKVSADFLTGTVQVLNVMRAQAEGILPVLLTFLATMGGSASVKLYQPIVLVISNIVLNIVNTVLMPLLILIFVFTILSNLTNVVKFEKFAAFFSSCFKWVLGTIFTIFMAFLSLKGIVAATYDGISIKTAKYAIRSYIPLLGGFLSEGFDVILTSSLLIKNAVGAAGILMLLATIVIPVISLAVFNLMLKLCAAICEPICDSRISNFLTGISKIMPYLIACILAVAFMFILTMAMAMVTATSFV